MTGSSQQKAAAGPAGGGDFDAVMQANIVRVFNERDPDRRRVALDELYTDNATLCDPETVATGPQAISDAVGSLHRMLPSGFSSPRSDTPWATMAPRGCSGRRVRPAGRLP